MENYFNELNKIDVSKKVEKKNGLSYLSWAYAWGELKKVHPEATYNIYENANGWCYHTDNKTCWVKTGVTVNDIEHIEYLPVMNYKNKSIQAVEVTSTDINKAIQRSLTKAVARHGLGLYIYAGEDLPESEVKKPTYQPKPQPQMDDKISEEVITDIEMTQETLGIADADMKKSLYNYYEVNCIEALTLTQANDCLFRMRGIPNGRKSY